MPRLHLLGTGAAVSDGSRTTTMLALEDRDSTFLIDCGGDAIQRAQAHNLDPVSVRALFLTHEHADHVSGFPLLMERLWLSERIGPLPIYGPADALDQARRAFNTFDTTGWDGLFEVKWKEIPLKDNVEVTGDENWSVRATPGDHGSVDVVGLRFTHKQTGAVVAYSADTKPSNQIAELARNADVFVHEATGHPNHSTPAEAGRIAARANASKLILVHLPPDVTKDHLLEAAQQFDSPAFLGKDGDSYKV